MATLAKVRALLTPFKILIRSLNENSILKMLKKKGELDSIASNNQGVCDNMLRNLLAWC